MKMSEIITKLKEIAITLTQMEYYEAATDVLAALNALKLEEDTTKVRAEVRSQQAFTRALMDSAVEWLTTVISESIDNIEDPETKKRLEDLTKRLRRIADRKREEQEGS